MCSGEGVFGCEEVLDVQDDAGVGGDEEARVVRFVGDVPDHEATFVHEHDDGEAGRAGWVGGVVDADLEFGGGGWVVDVDVGFMDGVGYRAWDWVFSALRVQVVHPVAAHAGDVGIRFWVVGLGAWVRL